MFAGKEIVIYLCFKVKGYIEEGVHGVVSYVGGRAECVWMWENMGEIVALRLVKEILRET